MTYDEGNSSDQSDSISPVQSNSLNSVASISQANLCIHYSDSDDFSRKTDRSVVVSRNGDFHGNSSNLQKPMASAALGVGASILDKETLLSVTSSVTLVESSEGDFVEQTSGDDRSSASSSPSKVQGSKRKKSQLESAHCEMYCCNTEGPQMKVKKMNGAEGVKGSDKAKGKRPSERYDMLEIDEEVDICQRIFHEIRNRITFDVFENVAEVNNRTSIQSYL